MANQRNPVRAGGGNGLARGGDGAKLAAVAADRMVADISSAGWPVGTVVGSESELLEQLGVSRAVLREAVRLLEHLQVARMRRGPGGGLVVLPPTFDSVTDAMSVYLYYVGATIEEVFEARYAIEEAAAQLASERIDAAGVEQLRAQVAREQHGAGGDHRHGAGGDHRHGAVGDHRHGAGGDHRHGTVGDHRRLHALVAGLSGNPAIEFFVDLLNRMMMLYFPVSSGRLAGETRAMSARAHAAIVDAIVSGDGVRARVRMRRHLEAEAEYMRTRRPSLRRLADLPPAISRSAKRAEQVALQVFGEITRDGWQVGTLLGSEAELMERYDVSRAVLREAVRVLEHHQVARMRRGPGGGLFVTEPGAEAVTDAIALQIDRLGIERSQLFEVRRAVEMAVLDLALERLDDDGIGALRAALAAEREVTPEEFTRSGHDLHGVLAKVTGNRVLELLTLVLIRLSRLRAAAPPDAPPTLPTQDVTRAHERIVQAVLDGDRDLARHRMRRHLDALSLWTR